MGDAKLIIALNVALSLFPMDRVVQKMDIKELSRETTKAGETIAEYEAGKLHIRLIDTYNGMNTLDELLYVIACNKLSERVA